MKYRMYDLKGKFIMELNYKPSPLDLIKDDATGRFYNISEINDIQRFCKARRNFEAEE